MEQQQREVAVSVITSINGLEETLKQQEAKVLTPRGIKVKWQCVFKKEKERDEPDDPRDDPAVVELLRNSSILVADPGLLVTNTSTLLF